MIYNININTYLAIYIYSIYIYIYINRLPPSGQKMMFIIATADGATISETH